MASRNQQDLMIERAVDAMRDDPFIDDANLLGTTQQDLRMAHYAEIALDAALAPGQDVAGVVERLRGALLPYPRLSEDFQSLITHQQQQLAAKEAEIEQLSAKLAAVERERDEARQALEHDRSLVIVACNEFSDAFARRSWLLEGRGSYEWDDDRYREEFSVAYDELNAPMKRLKKIGADWSNCPTDPDEIKKARTDWKAHADRLERGLQTIASTFFKEDQYQGYAKHVLAALTETEGKADV